MKALRKFMLVCLLMVAPHAHAGVTWSTQITMITLYEGGNLVYVYPAAQMGSPPACHGSMGNYYSFSMSRPMAKQYLAALLAAEIAGSTVTLVGKGTCTDQSVSETLDYIYISR